MISRLRFKFVVINMILVSLVLFIVFVSIWAFSYQRFEKQSFEEMNRILSMDMGAAEPKFEIGVERPPKEKRQFLPVISVFYDASGRIEKNFGGNIEISDDVLNESVSKVIESGKKEGVLRNLGLRYLLREKDGGVKIAFADMSSEREYMTNLLLISLSVGSLGLLAFLAISIFLAKLALAPVDKAWKQQQQFVADASHELKTPLTVILANIGILFSHKKDTVEEQIKWVEYIKMEAERMKKLVNDLLFLARSDACEAEAVFSEVSLTDVVFSCVLPFESVAFEQKIDLKSEIAPDVFILGSEGQLKQLIAIFMDNACKYAGENGRVYAELEKLSGKARVSVTNSGEPINEEEISHVFERFYRTDKSRARTEGGYGLGLSIAKSIVALHKGKISVKSSREEGTTFSAVFPLKKG